MPGDDGVVKLSERPDHQPAAYATYAWRKGTRHVLPLVSVLDPAADTALTVALPADANIPHFQFGWRGAKTLVLTLAHRGMGGGKPSPLRVLFYTHAADYRAALKAYADAFPAYFKPALPRGPYEGAFWYHHIQAHPDFAEMARQGVRYIWTSFWFTHLGEYLPAGSEWHPYTYAKWWKLGETMSDAKIRAFARSMHERGMGVYAYFNVTEYGGAGGKGGDPAEAQRQLREQFADALFHDASGKPVPTWEGSMAMNPGRRYALWPHLEEQVRRHLARLAGNRRLRHRPPGLGQPSRLRARRRIHHGGQPPGREHGRERGRSRARGLPHGARRRQARLCEPVLSHRGTARRGRLLPRERLFARARAT